VSISSTVIPGPAGTGAQTPEIHPQDVRILVVDYHAFTLHIVESLLAKDGYAQVRGTSDIAAAPKLFAELKPDIVVLDLTQPRLDGFALFDQFKKLAGGRHFAAIFLSAVEDRAIRAEAYTRGATEFLLKPIDETEIRLRVRNQARMVAFERALREHNERLAQTVAERTARLQQAIDVLKRAEAQMSENLKRSEAEGRDRMSFLGSINHELRTPLNAILGFAELMKDQRFGPLGNERYAEAVHFIHDGATHLLRLVNDLLNLASTESGDFRLSLKPVDVGATVRNSVTLLTEDARRSGVELLIDVAPDLPMMETDETRLKQIVINLASNAIKFTPSGGRVTVKVKSDNGQDVLILAISDTGVGISTEQMLEVLKPFGRVRQIKAPPSVAKQQGAGLGLPITKRLTELLGGTLDIQSREGVGTMITVRLPLKRVAAPGA
jgi:two-component system cell cycle sensor histidine kinase PleC